MSTIYVNEPATSGKVCLHTTVGDIDVELWAKECPLACRNFVQLCMEGYFNGTIFHRLVKGFIVQGGDPTGTGQGGESIYAGPFKDEYHQRLKFTRRGLVGMANAEKDANGSQFFFTLGAAADLDKKHTLFGKVVGNTLFNMLRLGEGGTDANDRPVIVQKIIGATILNNPFPDIVPRKKKEQKIQKEKKEKKTEKKNLALLSFGDEAEEDEEELAAANAMLKFKSKSAHDVLSDAKLSKEVAIPTEELAGDVPSTAPNDEVDEEAEARVSRIRNKLMKRKRKAQNMAEKKQDDEDLGKLIDEEKVAREKQQLEALSAELRAVQKEYIKALRKPKEKKESNDEEVPETEAMRMYRNLKLRFKESSKGIVKQKDAYREEQTMQMLEKFQKKLAASNREAILFDRKVEITEKTEERKIDESSDVPLGKLDLDAEDVLGDDWLGHRFLAPEEKNNVSKAKDASMREIDEEWYDVTDPRNRINQRRRAE